MPYKRAQRGQIPLPSPHLAVSHNNAYHLSTKPSRQLISYVPHERHLLLAHRHVLARAFSFYLPRTLQPRTCITMRPSVVLSGAFMLFVSTVSALPVVLNAPQTRDTMLLSQPSADWAGRGDALRRATTRWAANVDERKWLNQAVEAVLADRSGDDVVERVLQGKGLRVMHDRDNKH